LETDPESTELVLLTFINSFSIGIAFALVIMLVLIILSALISGSEVAFFSLTPLQKADLNESNSKKARLILNMLSKPEKLLATVLISNNLVNVGIVVLSTFVMENLFNFENYQLLGFLIQAILVTAIILLFGEILPKVYASRFSVTFARIMVQPVYVVFNLFSPFSFLLMKFSSFNKKSSIKKENFSIDDLSKALDLSETIVKEDKHILKGIATFRHHDAKSIMKPRMDVVAFDFDSSFKELFKTAVEEGFSRIPIFHESFDNIKGIIYTKDLLAYIDEKDDFDWHFLIREAFFIPETKKINVLLEEFRSRKIHFAVVKDEYGGSSGIVTLEDVLEEILGEIQDEMDEEESFYSRINDHTFIFDAKTNLNDFIKITKIDEKRIDKVRGDAETLAGLVLEIKNEIPKKLDEFEYNHIHFKILEADTRRIVSIKITIDN